MHYVFCAVAVAPVRSLPNHKAEMVTQLLYGEFAIVTDTTADGFVKITSKADGYEGWCQQQHVTAMPDEQYNLPECLLCSEWISSLIVNNAPMHLPFGCTLNAAVLNTATFTGKYWDVTKAAPNAATIKQLAYTFLNTPYLWGGRSVFGIDCSGFTQMVYKFLNISLQRDAHLQAAQGLTVDFLQQAQCGDLAFFDNENGEIIHVGILLNNQEIIHASGKVQIDNIDNGGIITKTTGLRGQKLRIIKRYF